MESTVDFLLSCGVDEMVEKISAVKNIHVNI